MASAEDIQSPATLKALSDPRRLKLIRLLMREPATLSQLGKQVGESAAWVRHHIKALQGHGLVEIVGDPPAGGFVEKYYRASAAAYRAQILILPAAGPDGTLQIVGSDDPGLRRIADALNAAGHGPEIQLTPIGSLEGLIALRQGLSELSASHLYDRAADEFNAPFVRHLFPSQTMRLITICHREQGLMVASGNPQGVRGLTDLSRSDLSFVNRSRGSGTRLWLDQELKLRNIGTDSIRGYSNEVSTHGEVAAAVHTHQADVGLGALASARAAGLDFVPLFEERFDLVLGAVASQDPDIDPLLQTIGSRRGRRILESMPGYRTSATGQTTLVG